MAIKKRKVGRPLIWEDPKAMQAAIDAYFEKCDTGKTVTVIRKGKPVEITKKIPKTIIGLTLALGFDSRASLLNYAARTEFLTIITRAKQMVEQDTIEGGMCAEYDARITGLNLAANFGYATKEEHKIDAGDNIMGLVATMINDRVGKK